MNGKECHLLIPKCVLIGESIYHYDMVSFLRICRITRKRQNDILLKGLYD